MQFRMFLGLVAVTAIACSQSDAGITTSVKSQLAADSLVKARRIDVDTKDRVVTLTGEVRTAEEETQALRLARNTNGVTNVVDQLRVAPDPASTGTSGLGEPGPLVTDASITVDVKAKLMADPDTSGLRIDVDTAGRVVTLTGTVKSQAEKDEALRLAREATGVTSVTDRLTVERRK